MSKYYMVIESGLDFEQILCLETGDNIPEKGILTWEGEGFDRHIFLNRKEAREAIKRTYHYAEAFGYTNMPDKSNCKIVPVKIPEITKDNQ